MKTKKAIKLFLMTGKKRSEEIELDNLDTACLVRKKDGSVIVENEYGTTFGIEELSDSELDVFIYLFEHP